MIKKFLSLFRKDNDAWENTYPDVVFHVGAPKSGTSAIQRFCMNNRKALLEKGYYYPEHSLDVNHVSGGHSCVAGPLIHGKREESEKYFQQFLAEAKKKKACLLLSAEALYGKHEAVHEMTTGLNIRVICFLRNPVEYLLANHNQGIKRHFSTQRLNELIAKHISRPAPHLSGQPLINWADTIGDENCIFKPYQAPDAGGDLIEIQFLRALGLSESDVMKLTQNLPGMTNRSYVKSALELKRLLNTVLVALPDQVANEVDCCMQGFSDQALDQRGFTAFDLSPEVRTLLDDKLLSQMQPVIGRFPQLQGASQISTTKRQEATSEVLDLYAPLAALKAKAPKALDSIYQQALVEQQKGRQDYAFCKLLDLLGIDFTEPKSPECVPGLTGHQREVLQNKNTQVADCLRELAVLLEQQGLLKDAQFAIEQALTRRPNGPGIQAIKARIDQTLVLK
jgi:hypothetical protein